MELIAGAAVVALAGLLAVSGVEKLRDLRSFRVALARYRLLPPWLLPAVARAVPVIELGLVVWLLLDRGA